MEELPRSGLVQPRLSRVAQLVGLLSRFGAGILGCMDRTASSRGRAGASHILPPEPQEAATVDIALVATPAGQDALAAARALAKQATAPATLRAYKADWLPDGAPNMVLSRCRPRRRPSAPTSPAWRKADPETTRVTDIASLAARDHLDPTHARTLTTYRTGVLSGIGLWNQGRRRVPLERIDTRRPVLKRCLANN
jgi:hypothetical protein